MKKIINNRYELTTCTATAASIGDTTRQAAIFFHDTEADFTAIDEAAFSTDAADLETVEF